MLESGFSLMSLSRFAVSLSLVCSASLTLVRVTSRLAAFALPDSPCRPQAEDLHALGRLLVCLCCQSLGAATQTVHTPLHPSPIPTAFLHPPSPLAGARQVDGVHRGHLLTRDAPTAAAPLRQPTPHRPRRGDAVLRPHDDPHGTDAVVRRRTRLRAHQRV